MKSYRDITGDGGSGVLEQVIAQRSKIADNLSRVRHLVAIGSGKGGVGKSTLTTHVAAALALRGSAVAILDADLNGPTQARLAGLRMAPPIPGESGLTMPRARSGIGVVSLGSMIPESRSVEFESVSRGESFVWRATREFAVLGELLAAVDWGELDYLLVDLPPGAERTFHYAEYFGDRASFVLVTVPSDLARGVVSRSVTALRRACARVLGYVENMRGYLCAGCGTIQPLFPDSGAVDLGLPCLGGVPFDPELSAICDRGDTLPESRPSFRAIKGVAERLSDAVEASR